MNKKAVFAAIFALALFPASLFPQTPPVLIDNDLDSSEYFTTGDITGSIGSAKAVFLVKPKFPDEAKEVGAEGKVKVEIEIDEEGSVTSAKAVLGHRSFYEAAQKAALQSKFLTPKINGRREAISGYLNYNFAIEKPNWFKVGYDLALIEKVPLFYSFQPAIIKKILPTDWQTENDLAQRLMEMKNSYPQHKPVLINQSQGELRSIYGQAAQLAREQRNSAVQNSEPVSIAQNLIFMLRGHLGNDAKSLWQFNLGVAFVEFQEVFRNPKMRRESFEILKRYVQDAPSDIQPAFLEQLQNLTSSAGQKISDQDRIEIGKTIANLQKIK